MHRKQEVNLRHMGTYRACSQSEPCGQHEFALHLLTRIVIEPEGDDRETKSGQVSLPDVCQDHLTFVFHVRCISIKDACLSK